MYERVPEPGSPRQTEGWALIEAAKRMAAAITLGDISDKHVKSQRKDAINLNWKLWTIFQAELTTGNSELDGEIQTNMLSLCKFVDKHTVGTLIDPTDKKMTALINLNRNIALGLLKCPVGETDASENERQTNAAATQNSDNLNDKIANPPPPEPVKITV